MKKITITLLMIVLIATVAFAIPAPKSYFVQLNDSEGNTPVEGDVTFTAWLNDATTDVLTEASLGCSYVYQNSTSGLILISVANFNAEWSVGDVIHVDISETSSGDTGITSDPLIAGPVQDYPSIFQLTAEVSTYIVSGNVGISAEVDLGGVYSTDTNGDYEITVDAGDDLTLTPSYDGYDFTPVSKTWTDIQGDFPGENFTAAEWNPDTPTAGLPSGADVGIDVSEISWSAPTTGNPVTKYIVTLADNDNFISPLVDAEETSGLFYSLSGIDLDYEETYHVKVIANYTVGGRLVREAVKVFSPKKSAKLLEASLSSTRGNSSPLIWIFTTEDLPTYTISGNVGVSAEIALGNGNFTNSSGNYTISVDRGDDLTITPVLTGYDFDPVSVSLTNIEDDDIYDFVATEWSPDAPTGGTPTGTDVAITTTELGWTAPAGGNPVTKYIVTLSTDGNPVTGFDGVEVTAPATTLNITAGTLSYSTSYDVEVIANYTPSRQNSLNGFKQESTLSSRANSTSLEWSFTTADVPTYTVSGYVGFMDRVDLDGVHFSEFDGTYSFSVTAGDDVTLTPFYTGFDFTPSTITFNNIQSDIVQDFVATEWTPDQPVNGLPSGNDIPLDVAILSWDAAATGVTPTSYFVVLADNPSYATPLIAGQTIFNSYLLSGVTLNYATTYYAQVIADWSEIPQRGSSAPLEWTFTTEDVGNTAPMADAGPDQIVDEGDLVTLDGTGSFDAETSMLSFNWTAPAGITLSDASAMMPTFIAPGVDEDINFTFTLEVSDEFGRLTDTDEVQITVTFINKAPIADAGDDQLVLGEDVVTLDGSGSIDYDGLDVITYNWIAPTGITLSDNAIVNPTFIAPIVGAETDYEFTLEVSDGHARLVDTDTVMITVGFDVVNPIADAGPDQIVVEGSVVTLDGSGTFNPFGEGELNYFWITPSGITVDDQFVMITTFTAPLIDVDTEYIFTLQVYDNMETAFDTDEVVITVVNGNQAPVADAGPDQAVEGDALVQLDASASYDPDPTDVLTYNWIGPGGITLSDYDIVNPTFTAPVVLSTTDYYFIVEVSDGIGRLVSDDEVKISVVAGNAPPVADAGDDQIVPEGVLVTLDGSASYDPDGTIESYSWIAPVGIILSDENIANPTFTAPNVEEDTDYIFTLVVDDGEERVTNSDAVMVTVQFVNQAPVADAGVDQIVPEETFVTLDGSASYDMDELDTITYNWIAPYDINISDSSVMMPTFTAPDVNEDVDYIFTLEIEDNHGVEVSDQVIVTVQFVNQTPVADAGPDQIVPEETFVTLDGSSSYDMDELDTITYSWTAPAGIVLSDVTAIMPTFTAPGVEVDTEFTFSLEVEDNHGATATDEVVITVQLVNQAPVADAGIDQFILGGHLVILDGSASYDPDPADVLTYNWTAPAGITLSDATAIMPTFTTPVVTLETPLTFSLEVSDESGRAVDSDEVIITVLAGNIGPIADAGDDQIVPEETLVTLDASGSTDADGAIVSYNWVAPAGIVLSDPTAIMPTFTAPAVEEDMDYIFSLTVDDGVISDNPERDIDSDDVMVTVLFVNQAPVADAGIDQTVSEGTFVSLDGSASYDNDELDTITYNWIAPAGITLSDPTAAMPTFTAPAVEADMDYDFTLGVMDSFEAVSSDVVVITVEFVNQAPIANAGIDQYVEEELMVTLNGSASYDPDELDVLTYNWIAPAGITLSDASAIMPTFMAPDVAEDMTYTFTLEVTDPGNLSDTDDVTINVIFINQAPVADAGVDQIVDEETFVTLDGSASYDNDELDTITYNWIAPAGITLSDPAEIMPTFTAPDVDEDVDYTFTLEVMDNHNVVSSDDVMVTVLFINQAPVADAGPDQTVEELLLVTLDGSASYDADGLDVLTYNWIAPAGFTLSDVAAIMPTFTAPDLSSDESYSFTLEVSDNNDRLVASDEVIINVEFVNHAPVADAGLDQTVNELELVSLDGSGSYDIDNGDLLSYNWVAPTGITLSDPAAIMPTFTAPDVDEDAVYQITLTVNDGHDRLIASDLVEITVLFLNQLPIADAGEDQTVNEASLVLLNGSGSYDVDGNDNLTYLWEAPEGITLSNPNVVNPTFFAPDVDEDLAYPIMLTVNDGNERAIATDEVVITVLFVNQNPVADAGDDQTVNELELVTLDGSGSYDNDGMDVLTYSWIAPEGITLSDATAMNPTFTAPEVDEDMDYDFELTVNDNNGRAVDSDEVTITVLFDNQTPVADAGDDQTVVEGDLVQLDASGSYDNDSVDVLTYNWEAPAGIYLADDDIMNPTFTAPSVSEDTDYTIVLTVNDGNSREIATDEVVITVMNFVYPYPVCAINPMPEDMATDVAITTEIGWTYLHDAEYTAPTEFRVLMGYDAELNGAFEGTVSYTGEGDYLMNHPFDLAYNTTYFWKVIPTSPVATRDVVTKDILTRDDAVDCPVWSFSTVALPEYTVSGFVGVYATVDLGDGLFTNEYGNYSVTLTMGDDITLSPTLYGYGFDPETVIINNIESDIVQNFEAGLEAPGAPENGLPNGIDVSLDTEELSWDAPSVGVVPTSYVITMSEQENLTNPIIEEVETSNLFHSINGLILNPSTIYYVRVYGIYTPEGGIVGIEGPALYWNFTTEDGLSGENPEVPNVTKLRGNFPNPFNPRTEIKFFVKEGDHATLTIYNIKGQQLVKKNYQDGEHTFVYNVDADATGIYFYKLQTQSYSEVRKMLMLK